MNALERGEASTLRTIGVLSLLLLVSLSLWALLLALLFGALWLLSLVPQSVVFVAVVLGVFVPLCVWVFRRS